MELEGSKERWAPLIGAVLSTSTLGSLAGSALLVLWEIVDRIGNGSSIGILVLAPFAVLFFALFAFFLVFPTVALVGVPLALILRRFAQRRWMPVPAVLIGSALGWLIMAWMVPYFPSMGALYGGATGYFWWRSAAKALPQVKPTSD